MKPALIVFILMSPVLIVMMIAMAIAFANLTISWWEDNKILAIFIGYGLILIMAGFIAFIYLAIIRPL